MPCEVRCRPDPFRPAQWALLCLRQSYFKRWWDLQEPLTQERVRGLVRDGQLDFAGGGWVSNDEAICTYDDIIDQLTIGHRWLISQLPTL